MSEILRRIARVFFIFVVSIIFTGFLFGEIWWWQSYKQKNVDISSGFETRSGKVLGEAFEINSENTEAKITGVVLADDARVKIIENYLKKYKSPLVPYSKLIFDLSETYGFEYYWIVAIAQQESNLCKKIPEGSHNCWGYGIHKKGSLGFDSYELALNSYAEYLKRVYFDKGLNTPELIMRKYCPSSDGSWARGVKQFINELETGV
jgi:hypothetical protein